MSEPQPTPPSLSSNQPPAKPPFARTAAQFCAWSPLIGIVFSMCGLGAVMMLAGIVLGIYALCSIPKHGRKGILVPATIGLTINAALIIVGVIGGNIAMEKARAVKAKAEQQQLQPQQQAR